MRSAVSVVRCGISESGGEFLRFHRGAAGIFVGDGVGEVRGVRMPAHFAKHLFGRPGVAVCAQFVRERFGRTRLFLEFVQHFARRASLGILQACRKLLHLFLQFFEPLSFLLSQTSFGRVSDHRLWRSRPLEPWRPRSLMRSAEDRQPDDQRLQPWRQGEPDDHHSSKPRPPHARERKVALEMGGS